MWLIYDKSSGIVKNMAQYLNDVVVNNNEDCIEVCNAPETLARFEKIVVKTKEICLLELYEFATKLKFLEESNACPVNELMTLQVGYYDWQDKLLPNENRPINISVSGPGQAQELVLTPVNGQVEFDFVSAVPGTFKIQATAEFPCDLAEIEVVVS